MKKLPLLAAAATGYVLGSRAGRPRYEQIKSGAQKVARNPKVQSVSGKAQDAVAQQAAAVAAVAKDKAVDAAHAATDKLGKQTPMQATP